MLLWHLFRNITLFILVISSCKKQDYPLSLLLTGSWSNSTYWSDTLYSNKNRGDTVWYMTYNLSSPALQSVSIGPIAEKSNDYVWVEFLYKLTISSPCSPYGAESHTVSFKFTAMIDNKDLTLVLLRHIGSPCQEIYNTHGSTSIVCCHDCLVRWKIEKLQRNQPSSPDGILELKNLVTNESFTFTYDLDQS